MSGAFCGECGHDGDALCHRVLPGTPNALLFHPPNPGGSPQPDDPRHYGEAPPGLPVPPEANP